MEAARRAGRTGSRHSATYASARGYQGRTSHEWAAARRGSGEAAARRGSGEAVRRLLG